VANPAKFLVEEVLEDLDALTNRQAEPLLEEIALLLVEDNRKGVLRGIDGEGVGMPPVTYRTGYRQPTARFRARTSQAFGTTAGTFKGRTRWSDATVAKRRTEGVLPNNNLTTAAYKRLTGPPLAPRGEQSRVITNHRTEYGRDGTGRFFVRRFWKDVVSAKGRAFLRHHFKGEGNLPRRDLRGIRPETRAKIRKAVWEFVDLITRPKGRRRR
jgi:hypothetical protein